jgi:DNA/RNA endonuclease G (NUC1)
MFRVKYQHWLRPAAVVFGSSCIGTLFHNDRHRNHSSTVNEGRTASPSLSSNDGIASPASPTLPVRMIRPNPNLEIVFDVRTRTPIYVLETLNGLPDRGGRRNRPQFYEDRTIDQPEYRSTLAHYRNSGFDRGHMAPAADYPEKMEDTFTLCNIAPQDHVMNLSVWNALEEWVRRVVRSQRENNNSTVYVVTGPLWLPHRQVEDGKYEYHYLGLGRPPSLIAVPTHFFKVVAVVNNDQIYQYACFVVHNHDKLPSKKLEDYVVPWKDLEAVTGLQFFPRWATPDWKDHADQLTREQVLLKRQNNKKLQNDKIVDSSPLLLTDGNRSSPASSRSYWKSGRTKELSMKEIQHLCSDGKCR